MGILLTVKKTITIIIIVGILIGGITGCNKVVENSSSGGENTPNIETVTDNKEIQNEEKTFPDEYMIKSENYFDYQKGLECSAFSSAYVLRHYGEEADGVELFKTFPGKLQDVGAPPSGIVRFFSDREYEAEYICNGTIEDLKRELSKGNPVIVFIHVLEPYTSTHATHYVPLVGYDNDYFYFAESLPYLANYKDEQDLPYNRKTEISKFERLWENIDGIWENPYFIISKK